MPVRQLTSEEQARQRRKRAADEPDPPRVYTGPGSNVRPVPVEETDDD